MEEVKTPFGELNHRYRHFKEEQEKDPFACGDELCEVIEILARTMCKVYVQYYLHQGAFDGALNLSLLDFFSPAEQQKGVTVGTWVLYSRLVQEALKKREERQKEREDPSGGADASAPSADLYGRRLLDVPLSQYDTPPPSGDGKEAPINRLLTFRNHLFMHGSMQANPDEVEEHEKVLLELVERLGFSHMQFQPGDGTSKADTLPRLCAEGECFASAPLFVENKEGLIEEREFEHTEEEAEQPPLIYDSSNRKLMEFYDRYREEKRGDFRRSNENFTTTYYRESYRPYPEIADRLASMVEAGLPFIKITGRPMTGKTTLVAHIGSYIPGAVPFRIDFGFLSHDVDAFEEFIKTELRRQIVKSNPKKNAKIPELIKHLGKEGGRLVIAIDNAQLAAVMRPGTKKTILDAVKRWKLSQKGDSPLSLIFVTRYASEAMLPGEKLEIPDTYSRLHDTPEEREKLLQLLSRKNPLSRQVIEALLSESNALPLWQISERVKKIVGSPVFTPKIEISLETLLADLVEKRGRDRYAVWEELRSRT